MTDLTRRYTVGGIDDQGDVHIYRTDDEERAKGMRELMAEDLEDVGLADSSG